LALRSFSGVDRYPICADVDMERRHMHGMGGVTGYGWWVMPLIPLAFLVLLALGAYYLLKEYTRTDRSVPSHGERALEILK